MKRMIAAFALMALAIAIAIYIAMAPMASPTATGALNSLLTTFDGGVDRIEASLGRSTGALVAIGIGLLLSLLVGLAPSRRRPRTDEDSIFVPHDGLDDALELEPFQEATEDDPSLVAPGAHDAAEVPEHAAPRYVEPRYTPEPVAAPETARVHEAEPAPLFTQAPLPLAPEPAPEPEAAPALATAPVHLVRKARAANRDWFGDASWFGGLPRLGAASWPRDTNGQALPFLAQVDLGEVAAVLPGATLPTAGSLAFFLGDGGVVPVPAAAPGETLDFSEPPQDLHPAFDEGGDLFPQRTARMTRWLFPFWPITPAREQDDDGASPRDHPFYAYGVGERVDALSWHSALHFADRLRDALEQADTPIGAHRERLREMREMLTRIENDPDADPYERDDARDDIEGLEAELAQIEEQRRSLPEMLAAMESFLQGREPWTPMTAEECEILRDLLPETHERYGELIGGSIPASLGEIATISLRTAISGPAEAVASIPPATLARINGEYRLPPEGRHMLFTHAHDSDEMVLVDLAWDDMLEWRWPGESRFQLRIDPRDAAEGHWHLARALFVQD
ncbi:DUF1963 domain-containing protein [Novosphingobium profundi]|uniref:DUF1963 domain-containing protein n=1 Tax=Novosphingobium profundi TaxID=1774954 RepID=UPI001BD97ACD|nr:DUF1963 domain-containing protein [Novosphingobium profundi]MBT0669788.1 DUF1963 domain-containing protein [Novosphingobium profundi]